MSVTPGLWAVNGNRVESAAEHGWVNDGWIIADCFGPDAVDNCRLMASAPNLLDALTRLVEDIPGDSNDTQWMSDELRRSIKRAHAAIAKAEGTGQ